MSLYFQLRAFNSAGTAREVARVNGDTKEPAVRAIAQKIADQLGERVEVRRVNDAVPWKLAPQRTASRLRRNPGRKPQTAREAIALVLRTAGWKAMAKEVLAGGDIRKALEQAAHSRLSSEHARTALLKSLALVQRLSPEQIEQPARAKRNPKRGARKRATKATTKRRNPATGSQAERAAKTFRKWHGFNSKGVIAVKGTRSVPARLVKLGEMPEIVYRSDKWTGKPQTYLHKFGRPRPLLATDPDGKRLFIIGGGYRVTERGLVD